MSVASEAHAMDRSEKLLEALLGVCTVANQVCEKLEHPTASVTINDQLALRGAITKAHALIYGDARS